VRLLIPETSTRSRPRPTRARSSDRTRGSDTHQNRQRIFEIAKQIIASALNSLMGSPSKLDESLGELIGGAFDALAKRTIKSCALRSDLTAADRPQALIGFALVPASPDWQQSAQRLADILITGSPRAK